MKKFLLFAAAAMVAVSASAASEKVVLKSFYAGEGSGTLGGWGGEATYESVEEDGKPCVKVTNPKEEDNDWSCQMAFEYDFEPGVTYYIDLEVKGTVDGSIGSGLQNSTTYAGGGNFTAFKVTKEWTKETIECTATAAGDGLPNRWTANFGKYVGTCYVTNMILYTLKDGDDTPGTDEATKNILKSFYDGNGGTLGGWGGQSKYENVEEDGKPCVKVTNPQEEANDWSCQMAFDYDFEPGVTYYIDFEVKGTVAGTISSALQNSTTYAGGGDFTKFNITTEWAKQTISCTATAAGDGLPNRWTANFGKYVGSAWFTNVVLYTLKGAGVEAVAVPVQVNTGVYNLQGVKVANSLEEVTVPGLYITNGKKVIKK